MTYLYWLLAFLFATLSVVMVLLILIQKGRGGGLSGAFGGAGGNTAFGSKTGDVLTWVTSVVFGLFLLLAIGLIWTGNVLHARNFAQAETVAEDPEAGDESADDDLALEPTPPVTVDETPDPAALEGGASDALGTGGVIPAGDE